MSRKWASTQRKALICLLVSGAISIVWGSFVAAKPYSGMGAFQAVYYGTRCLMQQSDPYNPSVLQHVYQAEGGRFSPDAVEASIFRRAMLICVNLPTSLLLIAPLAILPWKIASAAWAALNAAGILLASVLVWTVAGKFALKPSTLLICLLLANVEIVLSLGNLAAIVVSLCIVAVWCFLEERYVLVGVLCLAISLAFKPHDTGFVWFYFLLAGGALRKRALQSLGLVAALTLSAVLWTSHVAPRWPQELRANLQTLSSHGDVNDPGPDSLAFPSADYVISLQSLMSLIRDDPRFYNSISYLTCGLLLLAGAARVPRSRFTKRNAWIALAAIAPLSMLPVYHRTYDAKLLLLAVPACAMLWREGGPLKWFAAVTTTWAIASISDVPVAFLLTVMESMKVGTGTVWGRLLVAVVFHPAPLALLAMCFVYLWTYFRCTAREIRATLD